LRGEIVELRGELRGEIADLRVAMKMESSEVRVAIAELRADLLKWNLGAMATLTVIYSAIAAALRFVKP
jgi:hypothetical protein